MKSDEKKRLWSIAVKTGTVLGIGVAYGLFVRLTGWAIPCIFHLLTGLHCPGCGLTRMCLALLRLDFAAAARYNLLAFCFLPVAALLFLYKARRYVKIGDWKVGTVETVLYCIAFVLSIVFCVLRNTGTIPFLTMP